MSERIITPTPEMSADSKGAYLTSLYDDFGVPILYPKTLIDGKTRGGSHVCLPNFGPDASGVLEQHGFGRTSSWEVVTDEPFVKEFLLPRGEGEYEALESSLRYAIGKDNTQLTMRLTLRNTGDTALRVEPGFHPYFAVPEDQGVVSIDDAPYDLTTLAGTKYIDGLSHTLRVGERELRLHSDELTKWAIWTDLKGPYVCIEPTLNGPSFNDESSIAALLQPGSMQTYDFSIHWD